jgi:protein MpaA
VSPIPTIPEDNSDSTPLLASFANREAIPNDTEIEFGRSVQNRPLTFIRRGNPNGIRVLVVGVIHGDEPAGLAVTDILKKMDVPANVDLWILPELNPDGIQLKTRQNANKVDLNRNFPVRWKPLGEVGFWQWAGTGPATEPEVNAMMKLGKVIQPQFNVWYHQDYFRISPGLGRDGDIRERYAMLVDLPLLKIAGGTYSGTATMWADTLNKNDTVSLLVEFGKGLREGEAQANADAIYTVVKEFFPS